jgi:formylglycine-generating enzyme required for sulfatase activity
MATTPPGSVAVKLKRGGAFATVYAKPGDRLRDEGCGDAACPELFLLPKGTYKRGSEESDIEKPVREVTIGYHVAVGSTEVTRGEFAAFVKATGHRADGGCYALDSKGAWGLQKDKSWRSPGFAQTDDHPVVCVSWDDTQAYINWLSSATGQTYRLLTEAEWEHAARGVTSAGAPHPRFHFGDDEGRLGDFAWYSANSGNRTQPVGGKKRNAFGLFDMHGNVWEWVQDCWAENYDNAPTDGSALENDQCSIRALRGGSWHFPPPFLRAAFRFRLGPDYRDGIFGFRLLGVLGSARTF